VTLAEYEAYEGKIEYFDGGDEVASIVRWMLGERDVAVPDDFSAALDVRALARLRKASEAEVVAAADAATSAADFLARLAAPGSAA